MRKVTQEFNTMLANYEKLAAHILGSDGKEDKPVDDPLKIEWATQEGYRPHYNPNSDEVSWIRQPQPVYQVPMTLKMQGSMSPEALAEVYPMFAVKQQEVDPVLAQIFEAALKGDITQQRARELTYQLLSDTYKTAGADQKPTGAAAKSSSYNQTISNAAKGQRVAGVSE